MTHPARAHAGCPPGPKGAIAMPAPPAGGPRAALSRRLRGAWPLGALDAALLAATALMLATDRLLLLVHLVFLLLTIGAFFWERRWFAARLVVWGGLAAAQVVAAVAAGRARADELAELPLLTAILLLVFAIAAQRSRAQEELARLARHTR